MNLAALVVVTAFTAATPTTTITSGPDGRSTLTTPTFEFASDVSSATFECSLDGAVFSACASPTTVEPLALGRHTFAVRAVAPDGSRDPSPPVRDWQVVASPTAYATITLAAPRRRHVAISAFRKLSGTAVSPSGVHGVYAALQRGGSDKNVFPPGCTYVDLATGQLVEQPCLLPHYQRMRGNSSWHYTLPARVRRVLRPGSYKLILRAFNGYDQAVRKNLTLNLR